MIKIETLEKVTEKMNEALAIKNIDIKVVLNVIDGLSLSKKFDGIEIKFPCNTIDSIQMTANKSFYGESDTLKFIRNLSECAEIIDTIRKPWMNVMCLSVSR